MEQSIKEYLENIYDTDLVIPNFQREYSWNKDNVKKLIGSLLFKLKIGAILTYKDKLGSIPYLFFNKEDVYSNDSIRKVEYLIDGQQRLTSILIAFTGFYHNTSMNGKYKRKYFIVLDEDTDYFGLDTFDFKSPVIGEGIDYDDFVEDNIDFIDCNNDYPNVSGKLPVIPVNMLSEKKLRVYLKLLTAAKVEYIMRQNIDMDFNEIDELSKKAEDWTNDFMLYAKEILEIKLEKITIKNNIQKAIKTYQIMNKSGKPLTDLDILASHYSLKDNNQRLYDVIMENFSKIVPKSELKKVDKYGLVKNTEETLLSNNTSQNLDWNFHEYMIDSDCKKPIPNKVLDQLIKLLMYANANDDEKYLPNTYKSSRILKLDGDSIKNVIVTVIDSMNWAASLLQIRCGLTNIVKLNNFWMLFVLSALKLEVGTVKEKDIDKILAWYFLSRFTGRYRIDQNTTALFDLRVLIQSIIKDENVLSFFKDFWSELSEDGRKSNKTIRKDILLCRNRDVEPMNIISQFICEYGIKDGYKSKILTSDIDGKINDCFISTLSYPFTKNNRYRLDIDHVHPLELGKTLKEYKTDMYRKDTKHELNSPLNKAYLTAFENNYISTMKYTKYKSLLSDEYKINNCLKDFDEYSTTIERRYDDFFNSLYMYVKIRMKL